MCWTGDSLYLYSLTYFRISIISPLLFFQPPVPAAVKPKDDPVSEMCTFDFSHFSTDRDSWWTFSYTCEHMNMLHRSIVWSAGASRVENVALYWRVLSTYLFCLSQTQTNSCKNCLWPHTHALWYLPMFRLTHPHLHHFLLPLLSRYLARGFFLFPQRCHQCVCERRLSF